MRHGLYIIKFVLLLSYASASQSEPPETIPFYLPYSATEFPNIDKKLEYALSEVGLDHFKVHSTDYWHPYQQGLRQGRTGVYFAAPHFTAWSISKNKFVPILRLKNKLQYVIVARRADSEIFEVNDLAGQTVCTQRAPNLDFLLSRTALKRAPVLARTQNVESVPQAMTSNQTSCKAFSVSRHIFEDFAKSKPFEFIRLQQSAPSKNYAFVIDRKTAIAHGLELKKFLQSSQAKSILKPLYKLYSSSPILVSTKSSDYTREDLDPLKGYWW